MRLRTVLGVVLLAALALPAGAGAVEGNPKRYELSWVEHMRKSGRIVMTFRVKQVHFQFDAWAAEVEFHNRSRQTMRIRPQFALLVSKSKGQDPDYQALLVRRSEPALPRILFPGQRWRGVMAGPGRPRNTLWIRFNWITDHSFQLAETA